MDFRRFGLNISEQTSRCILTSIHSAQKPPQAIIAADEVFIVTSTRELLCLEAEIERLPLAAKAKLQIGLPSFLRLGLLLQREMQCGFRPVIHHAPRARNARQFSGINE